ncbi:MAG TPA: phosphotransferase [Pseudonocardia sp.]|nr:phosphotransferase [Pseudonocardia sp.]
MRGAGEDDHRHLTVDAALRILDDPPEPDVTVVCHGHACAPNAGRRGRELHGHVDLGDLGVGDRWADLAVATWSTVWNYGPGWERRLLDAYGVAPEPERTAYFRLVRDLGP